MRCLRVLGRVAQEDGSTRLSHGTRATEGRSRLRGSLRWAWIWAFVRILDNLPQTVCVRFRATILLPDRHFQLHEAHAVSVVTGAPLGAILPEIR
jgi:hypothetical protein